MSRRVRVRPDDDGAYLVLYALLAVVIFSMGAIVLDLATLRQDRSGDRLAADLAVTAGAARLDATNPSTPAIACQDAWEYFLANIPASATPVSPPDCPLSFPPLPCTSASPAATAVGTAGPFRFEVTTPVPDASTLMKGEVLGGDRPQGVDPGIDGTQCDRLAVRVLRQRDSSFSVAVGIGSTQTDVHSVGRADDLPAPGQVTELVVLDSTACGTLSTTDTVTLRVVGAGQTGDIAVDSDASGCGPGVVVDVGDTSELFALAPAGPGLIRSRALAGDNPTAAFDPADASAGRLSPTPTPSLLPVGRSIVDRQFNCTPPVCGAGQDHVNRLRADVGAGVPVSYLGIPILPYLGPCAVALPTIIPAGNWYVPCPVFDVASDLTFEGGLLVFQGGVEIAAGACMSVGDASCGGALALPVESIVYLQSGDLHTSAGARLVLHRTMVHLSGGAATVGSGRLRIDDDPGATGQLTWSAPLGGVFEDLLLWAESGDAMHLAGQSTFTVDGVVFTPHAQLRLTPSAAGASTATAQVVTARLVATGAGTFTLAPTPSRAVSNTARSVRLLR
ncbi:MAG: hypothetical protein ACR2H3_09540 [Acidimicrobiales bacterium]